MSSPIFLKNEDARNFWYYMTHLTEEDSIRFDYLNSLSRLNIESKEDGSFIVHSPEMVDAEKIKEFWDNAAKELM